MSVSQRNDVLMRRISLDIVSVNMSVILIILLLRLLRYRYLRFQLSSVFSVCWRSFLRSSHDRLTEKVINNSIANPTMEIIVALCGVLRCNRVHGGSRLDTIRMSGASTAPYSVVDKNVPDQSINAATSINVTRPLLYCCCNHLLIEY